MFSRGGLAILDAIESSGYDSLNRRPSLSKWTQAKLLGRTLIAKTFAAKSEPAPVTPIDSSALHVASLGDASAIRNESANNDVATRRVSSHEPYSLAVRESYAECNRIARASRSSFYLAFYGLRKEKRNALCSLYAFMRLIDDVSDEAGDLESKRQGLARWRAMLDEAVDGRTSAHPVLPALADTITRFAVPPRFFHDLILGAEMDLTIANVRDVRPPHRILLPRGRHRGPYVHPRLRFQRPESPDLAERLGLAFQLTNIIRDVGAELRDWPRLPSARRPQSLRRCAERACRSDHSEDPASCSHLKRTVRGSFTRGCPARSAGRCR